ncbi:MAG: prephenate dehydrogenase/arogenate dehydrogenase family protein [Nitrospirae bacterium]|nr:prephenate dehydrogenase/arogenate dehydrogenase family protein [Nitrospirota bacterium]
MAFLFRRVVVVGVGLMGGSMALGLRRRRLVEHVVGAGRNASRLRAAKRAGVIDAWTLDPSEAAAEADLVALCTPPEAVIRMGRVLLQGGNAESGPIVTDVAGVKLPIVRALGRLPNSGRFVGAHPMAGTESSGWRHARENLFEGAACVVTPGPRSQPAAVRAVERVWRALGARPMRLTPRDHDRVVALISHLPHVIAYSYAGLAREPQWDDLARRLGAGSYRDMTRVARESPELWASLLATNAREVGPHLDRLIRRLKRMRAAMRRASLLRPLLVGPP